MPWYRASIEHHEIGSVYININYLCCFEILAEKEEINIS